MGTWRKPVTVIMGLGAFIVLAGCEESTPRLRADAQVLVAIDRDHSATVTASGPERSPLFALGLTAKERAKLPPEQRLMLGRLTPQLAASGPGQYRDPRVAARRVADALFPSGTVTKTSRHGSSATVHVAHAVQGSTLRFDPDATLGLAVTNGLRTNADVFLDVCTRASEGRWSSRTTAHDQQWGCAAWWTFEPPGAVTNAATLHIGSYPSPSDGATLTLRLTALALLATAAAAIVAARRRWKWRPGLVAVAALVTIGAFAQIFRFRGLVTAANRTREVFGYPVDRTIAHTGTVGGQWAAALAVAALCVTIATLVEALRPPPDNTSAADSPTDDNTAGATQAV